MSFLDTKRYENSIVFSSSTFMDDNSNYISRVKIVYFVHVLSWYIFWNDKLIILKSCRHSGRYTGFATKTKISQRAPHYNRYNMAILYILLYPSENPNTSRSHRLDISIYLGISLSNRCRQPVYAQYRFTDNKKPLQSYAHDNIIF